MTTAAASTAAAAALNNCTLFQSKENRIYNEFTLAGICCSCGWMFINSGKDQSMNHRDQRERESESVKHTHTLGGK